MMSPILQLAYVAHEMKAAGVPLASPIMDVAGVGKHLLHNVIFGVAHVQAKPLLFIYALLIIMQVRNGANMLWHAAE